MYLTIPRFDVPFAYQIPSRIKLTQEGEIKLRDGILLVFFTFRRIYQIPLSILWAKCDEHGKNWGDRDYPDWFESPALRWVKSQFFSSVLAIVKIK